MATVQGHTLGDRMPRKEDGRFIRGKGNYVDDVRLPGCYIRPSCAALTPTPG